MSKVTIETIDHLSHLARLQFNEQEKIKIQADLEKIIGFCEKLNEVNTDGVEPMIYVNEEYNVLREDVLGEMLTQKEALLNAPKKDSDYFRIPKVLENKDI